MLVGSVTKLFTRAHIFEITNVSMMVFARMPVACVSEASLNRATSSIMPEFTKE
ncbi:hypothetical protein BIW11_04296 [Tropilaelaps mercedesae]|uniref:Uncharacterized protein n=1 Tax=Tropilaelaps mercedesae TaxID=418985 RepID=A0A1V9X896_9ACAR|nr:hypothetical protein BIW11_04296 [Tropilaelaps mercedesae]